MDKNNEFELKDFLGNILKVEDVVLVARLTGRSSVALGEYDVGGFYNYTKNGSKRVKISVALFRDGSECSSVENTELKLVKIK